MIGRRQLAVASPISIGAVAGAFAKSFGPANTLVAGARRCLEQAFHAQRIALTDSGTSALVLALRLAVPKGAVVGLPGYACVDLTAAALAAGVRVRLYDLDPETLSPDLDSVDRMLKRGVAAVVVAHLYGYPADVPGVRALANRVGAVVIEDAAQGAGGSLDGRRLGSLADLTVLSFGRGKGLCAGGGGALLAFSDRWSNSVESASLEASGRGWGGLAKTAVQWMLGRPSLYALPSMVPWLRLGEMVYHAAGGPAAMSRGSNALVASALRLEGRELEIRRANASRLAAAASRARGVRIARPIAGGAPGYLRYAIRDVAGAREPQPSLGVLRSYPSTLAEQAELAPILEAGEPAIPGALELRRSTFTAPTHRFVSAGDIERIGRWMGADQAPDRPLKRVQEQQLDVTRGELPR